MSEKIKGYVRHRRFISWLLGSRLIVQTGFQGNDLFVNAQCQPLNHWKVAFNVFTLI